MGGPPVRWTAFRLGSADLVFKYALTASCPEGILLQKEVLILGRDARVANKHEGHLEFRESA